MSSPMYSVTFYRRILKKYKVGDVYSYENAKSLGAGSGDLVFSDAPPGRMKDFPVRIGLIGFTGAGKTAFINSVAKSLDLTCPADVQSTGGEGTILLEDYYLTSCLSLLDTRGFGFDIHSEYVGNEIHAIVDGHLKTTEEIGRDKNTKAKLKQIVKHPPGDEIPLEEKVHALIFIIRGSDPRIKSGAYRSGLLFPFKDMQKRGLAVTTVVTFSDEIEEKSKPDIRKAVKAITGDLCSEVFFITNFAPSSPAKESSNFNVSHQQKVLNVLYVALLTAETNIQVQLRKERPPSVHSPSNKKTTVLYKTVDKTQEVVRKAKDEHLKRREEELKQTKRQWDEEHHKLVQNCNEERKYLKSYRFGQMLGHQSFHGLDVFDIELSKDGVKIALMGMTGAGKSALINTCEIAIGPKCQGTASIQSKSLEGTIHLEEFLFDCGVNFRLIDTRGFCSLHDGELRAIKSILYGHTELMDEILFNNYDEGHIEPKALKQCMHAVIFVVRLDDARFFDGTYERQYCALRTIFQKIDMVPVTVISHENVLTDIPNETRWSITRKASAIIGSPRDHIFFIENYMPGFMEMDCKINLRVFEIIRKALLTAEQYIKLSKIKQQTTHSGKLFTKLKLMSAENTTDAEKLQQFNNCRQNTAIGDQQTVDVSKKEQKTKTPGVNNACYGKWLRPDYLPPPPPVPKRQPITKDTNNLPKGRPKQLPYSNFPSSTS